MSEEYVRQPMTEEDLLKLVPEGGISARELNSRAMIVGYGPLEIQKQIRDALERGSLFIGEKMKLMRSTLPPHGGVSRALEGACNEGRKATEDLARALGAMRASTKRLEKENKAMEVEEALCSPDLRLPEVEHWTLESLISAVESLVEAERNTKNGLASDHMHNAMREIRLAMRKVGG